MLQNHSSIKVLILLYTKLDKLFSLTAPLGYNLPSVFFKGSGAVRWDAFEKKPN